MSTVAEDARTDRRPTTPVGGPSGRRRIGWATALVVFAVLMALPYVLTSFTIVLLSSALILGVYAVGLNIVVGGCGMVSLGHGAFFVFGAYIAGILFSDTGSSAVIGLLAAFAGGAVFGAVFALVAQFVRGGYLVMLTIALLQVAASLVETLKSVTGGSDGLLISAPKAFAGWLDLSNIVNRYWFIVCAAAVALLVIRAIMRSPLGGSFHAIRQNEARMRCLGYRVLTIKVVAWAMSGAFAAFAGCLSAANQQVVSTSDVSFESSALPLLVLCIVGTRGVVAPFVGALAIVLVRDQLAPYVLGRQVLLLGCLFVAAAYIFPDGVSREAVRSLPGRMLALVRKVRHEPAR